MLVYIILIYTIIKKIGVNKVLNVFERSLLCSSKLHLFDKKVKVKQQYCEKY